MNASFRTRLFLSYFLLIALASGIVYAVAVVQIQQQIRNEFDQELAESTDEIVEEVEELLFSAYQEWMCEEVELLPADKQVFLEELLLETTEGETFSCTNILPDQCDFIAEELELNQEIVNDASEEELILFCDGRYERFESAEFKQELQTILDGAAEANVTHTFLLESDLETAVAAAGEGPGYEANQLRRYEVDEELLDAVNFGALHEVVDEATDEEFEYMLRYAFSSESLIYMIFAGQPTGSITADARLQALTIAGLTAAAGLVLLLILGSWMANTLSKPLTELRASAQAMAAGQLDTRADTSAPPEIRELAEDFNTMAAAVEAMVAEQRAFANNAAHELRTPLTAMRIRTEALLEDDPDEQLQQAYISEIHDEIGRLSRLVEDLRTLSRADAQNMEAGDEEVNLVNLVRALQREFNKQIKEKGLAVELESEELFIVKASASHMRTALRNVLENAIKYNTAGGRIDIRLRNTGHGHEISVRDTGIGIPAGDLPHLTKRFYRVDKAHNRNVAGSGLGLSLVRSIVELYGGRLEILSDGVGQGSTVTILLSL